MGGQKLASRGRFNTRCRRDGGMAGPALFGQAGKAMAACSWLVARGSQTGTLPHCTLAHSRTLNGDTSSEPFWRCAGGALGGLRARWPAGLGLPLAAVTPLLPQSHTSTLHFHASTTQVSDPGYRRACGIPEQSLACRRLGQWLCDKACFPGPRLQGPGGIRCVPAALRTRP
jgi:hypothetical protein